MEDFSTIIYILFIILSLAGGLLGKDKKNSPSPKKAQTPRTQKTSRNEKTLQEMMDEMLKKHAPQQPESKKETVFSEESKYEFGKYESDNESLEEIISDEGDHRNKNVRWMMVEEEKSHEARFKVDDWKQAIVISEVLGKPKALQ
jgi:site-specific DNA-cytosine methylase